MKYFLVTLFIIILLPFALLSALWDGINVQKPPMSWFYVEVEE